MAKYVFRKTHGGVLIPGDESVQDKMQKVENGTDLIIEIKFKRNPLFHRKAFALLNLVFQSQDRYKTLEDLLIEFKLKSGHYQEHITTKGKVIYQAKSIAFDEMDQIEFEELYSKWIDIALLHFVSMEKQELETELLRFM